MNTPLSASAARAAIAAWLSQDAYVSGRGYYYIKSGGRAPWDAAAREIFRGSDELHAVAHLPADKRAAWLKCRLAGGDPIRVDWYAIKKAAKTVKRHHHLITLALNSIGADSRDVPHVEAIIAALDRVAKGWRPDEPCADVNGFVEDKT